MKVVSLQKEQRDFRLYAKFAAVMCMIASFGCSNRPSREQAPAWSPQEMAQDAIEQIDQTGDGQIDRKEAQQSPGLLDAFEILDSDSSGTLSVSEIKQRFELYQKLKTAFIRTTLQVNLNNRPLSNAYIKLIPEEYQADSLQTASGITDGNGQVTPQTEGQNLPAMQPGFYRVELYKDQTESKPITVKTPLGIESSPQSRSGRNSIILLNFETK